MPRLAALVLVGLSLVASTSAINITQFNGTADDFLEFVFPDRSGIDNVTVTFIGDPQAFGTFTDGSVIGFEEGFIISTGEAEAGEGPNSGSSTSGSFFTPGDSDLAGISPINLDAAVIEITFDALVPVIFSLDFAFASEEYNEFLDFQDPFGFFADGVNVALAANGGPVSVSNVNCGPTGVGTGPNCAQFINNEDGAFDIEYDGFTVILTATSAPLAVGPHTIKLAIADEFDTSFDTASFFSQGVIITEDEFFATTKSDPHVKGFKNQEFDFDGEPGNVYSFLSCPGLEMNVLLSDAYTTGFSATPELDGLPGGDDSDLISVLPFKKKGTWITEVGLVLDSAQDDGAHTIFIRAQKPEEEGPMAIKHGEIVVDGHLNVNSIGDLNIEPGTKISVSNSRSYTRVSISSQQFGFKAIVDVVSPPWTVDQGVDQMGIDANSLWHLNVKIARMTTINLENIHGVIGQTMNPRSMRIEGEEADYIVKDGILGHNFVFDKFESQVAAHRSLMSAESSLNIPRITSNERDAFINMDLSVDALAQMSEEEFSALFHTYSPIVKSVVNEISLGQAVEFIKQGQLSAHDVIRTFETILAPKLIDADEGMMTEQNSADFRDTIQRITTALDTNADLN